MKHFLSALLFILSFSCLYAQEQPIKYARNTVSVEIRENSASWYALNYERIFRADKLLKYSLKIGVGASPSREPDYSPFNDKRFNFIVPAEVNIFIGNKRDHVEIGGGITYQLNQITLRNIDSFMDSNGNVVRNYRYVKNRYHTLFLTSHLAYRYQPQQKGVFFKGGVNLIYPSITYPDVSFAKPTVGFQPTVSVGYAF